MRDFMSGKNIVISINVSIYSVKNKQPHDNNNMSNRVAVLSSSLRQKDTDRSALTESIKNIEELKKHQVIGKLSLVVTAIDSHHDFEINFLANPSDQVRTNQNSKNLVKDSILW